jgi:hypothetical protein
VVGVTIKDTNEDMSGQVGGTLNSDVVAAKVTGKGEKKVSREMQKENQSRCWKISEKRGGGGGGMCLHLAISARAKRNCETERKRRVKEGRSMQKRRVERKQNE